MDDQFKKIITKIKPLAKSLPRNSNDRHTVTMWIKKLLAETDDKFNRNHYAQLLLNSLQHTQLQPPFTANPPTGTLPHVQDELDALLHSSPEQTNKSRYAPIQTENSMGNSTSGIYSLLQTPHHSTSTTEPRTIHSTPLPFNSLYGEAATRTFSSSLGTKPVLSQGINYKSRSFRSLSTSPRKNTSFSWHPATKRRSLIFTSSSSPENQEQTEIGMRRSNSMNLHLRTPTSSSDSEELSDVATLLDTHHSTRPRNLPTLTTRNTSPTQIKFTTSPSNFIGGTILSPKQEESIIFNSEKHDSTLKKILDHKNKEIESIRTEYSLQNHQIEATCRKLEAKVIQLEKQCNLNEEEHEKEIEVARQLSQQQQQNLRAKFEQKLHTVVDDFEQQRLDLEHEQSQKLQSVLEDANERVSKMEIEYQVQKQSTEQVLRDLEKRLHQVVQQLDIANQTKDKILKEKNSLNEDLKQARTKIEILERQCTMITNEKETSLKQSRAQAENSILSLKHEMSLQQTKAADKISTLQEQLTKLQHTLDETIAAHKLQLMEAESVAWKQMKDKETEHIDKIKELQSLMREKESEANEKLSTLELLLKEKESCMKEMKSNYDIQLKTSEKSVEEYKMKVELQMNKMFDDMKKEIERLEYELTDTKQAKEKQEDELYKRLSEERKKMTDEHAAELSAIRQHHQTELQKNVEVHLQSKEQILTEMRKQLKEQQTKHIEEINDNEKVIVTLKEDLRMVTTQLEEQSTKLEIENKNYQKYHELETENLKAQMSALEYQLRDEHKQTISTLMDKHSIKLQQLQHDQQVQTALAEETVASLQSELKALKEDYEKNLKLHFEEVEELKQENEQTINTLKQQHEANERVFRLSAESAKETAINLEQRIQQLQQSYESKLSQLKSQYESRMMSIMPLSTKQEYEDTIQSLKLQVKLLNQRADVLQKQLAQVRTCSNLRKHLRTASVGHQTLSKSKQ